jgi:multidrug transporter EmrE-like cation transporter
MRVLFLLVLFWTWQVIAQLFFKHGSGSQQRWLICFVLGNLFGASSIWFLMKLYARMNANLAMALGGGGAFLAIQAVLALVFHTRPAPVQWIAYVLIAVGMAMATAAGRAGA